MKPEGAIQFEADVKEGLLEELEQQSQGLAWTEGRVESLARHGEELAARLADGSELKALRVIVAIGRSGNYRKLGVTGEEASKVYQRLHDPKDYAGQDVLVVGGGDSALESAIAISDAGGRVTLSYRKPAFSRAKPDNIDAVLGRRDQGKLAVHFESQVREIRDREVSLESKGGELESIPNDVVFKMIGREAPLDFFRRSGIRIRGEGTKLGWLIFALFLALVLWIYNWKSGGYLSQKFAIDPAVFRKNPDPSTVMGTLGISMLSNAFWYTLAYTLLIGTFGFLRIRRRRTRYVTLQTLTLFFFQALPLFLLPELILPLLGYNGFFDSGMWKSIADSLFPSVDGWTPAAEWHNREYWRAYGLILAWPLNVYNVFTASPLMGWLIVAFVQTFVLIPLLVWRYGKGAYCGWICSCGGLAETLGDTERRKMPHGPFWNRLNMTGQVILALAFVLFLLRVVGWIWPSAAFESFFSTMLLGTPETMHLSYKWIVDVFLAGTLGVGLYFKLSGRVWCRFACPLAALMHIYARFSRFRIFSDKKKCISCNECTSVCHMGIDVMNFANKGEPMRDPECVRCSACVQTCPTEVLSFGQQKGGQAVLDRVSARPVDGGSGAAGR